MEIASPFVLLPHTGQLSLEGFQTRFGPLLHVSEFQKSDLFPFATRMTLPSTLRYDHAFQIPSITLPDRRWAYLSACFRERILVRLGFGWGTVREYGFHELTVAEFQEQLRSYTAWLQAVLGPSLSCDLRQAYRQEFQWGTIEAGTDWRTELAGIAICFESLQLPAESTGGRQTGS